MGYEKNEQIMELLKARGPILPVEAAKRVDSDIIIASAYLATMVSREEVKMSHLRVGGSPLYYLPGQESMLQNFADRLNPPEKRAYNLIKERKILRDNELEPVQRVSLRAIKDFALPLNVKHENNIEIFWKWYLLSDAEAEPLIKKQLQPEAEEPAAEKITQAAPEKAAEQRPAPRPEPLKPLKKEAAEETKEIREAKAARDQREALADAEAEIPKPCPVPILKKSEDKPARKRPAKLKQEVLTSESPARPTQETTAAPQPMPEQGFSEPETKDKFFEEVKGYFSANNIMILESAIVKKNSELDLVVSLPSAVGRLTYYCKAKNKKKSNEGDLASAYVQGQSRKLPTLYLSRGDLMKKASEMLSREFRGIVVKTF